ncbi:toprim domain-containing protein [Phenylobacterium sp. SCN 70-31]|uniref:toprim domain-containing protein n=1 Tax=Phenylobacterium sp. SCN 70-31 TaxID=1660129 RepID=UPI00086BEB6B|nr:toprim domain-containing protein [Phenylobacterium sp. SCN 70-31]ODT84436.1 MAG: virulence-associated protein E [Phenylobacterium sp. SCN 70-31]
MSLKVIVEVLGGDLYDGGRRANIPAPGHSRADRSVSLLLKDDRVIVHTFGDGDWQAVLDDLRAKRLIDAHNAPRSVSFGPGDDQTSAPKPDFRRLDAARRLWDAGRPVAGALAERHCRLRHIQRALPGSQVLRHGGETPVSAYAESRYRRPALLVAISAADGSFSAVEITYLAANGQRALDLRLPRKTVGLVPPGSAVRLDPAAPEMLVAEGVFTTLSATERFGLPGWALQSTRNLKSWSAPEGVRKVLIAADRGKDGEASAEILAARLRRQGVAADIAFPPEPYGDWNEAARPA